MCLTARLQTTVQDSKKPKKRIAHRRRCEVRVWSAPSSVLKPSLSLSELSASCFTGRWLARGMGMRLMGPPGRMLKLMLLL